MGRLLHVFIIVAAVLYPPALTNAASGNLVANGGFEDEVRSGGIPSGWSIYVPGARATVEIDKTVAVAGEASIRLRTESDIKAVLVSDPIPVAPGEQLQLRIWYRTADLSTKVAGALVFSAGFLDAQKHYFQWHRAPSPPGPAGQWHPLGMQAPVPAGAAYVTFQVGVNRMTGTIWWDQAELVTESPVALRFALPSSISKPGMQQVNLILLNREPSWAGRSVTLQAQPGAWHQTVALTRQVETQIPSSFSLQKRGDVRLSATVEDAGSGQMLFEARHSVTVPPLLKTEPVVPTHWCVEDGPPRLEGRLWIYEFPGTREDLKLSCVLRQAEQVIAEEHVGPLPSANPIRYRLEPSQVPPGDYVLDLILKQGDKVEARTTLDWHVIRRDQARVTLGAAGFPIVDGKPVLPIGMFNGGRFPEQAQAGFNVAHGYNAMATRPDQVPDNTRAKQFLDTAASLGMKTLMLITHGSHARPVDDEFIHRVKMFRNHPGLLAWDEEEGVARGEMPLANLARMREVLQAQDPHHPFMVGDTRKVVFEIEDRSRLFPDTLMDMGMWWWYPFPLTAGQSNDALAGEDATDGRQLPVPEFLTGAKTDKPIWIGLQAYRKPDRTDGRFPTPEEYRAQTYLALIHGAKGLMYYVGSGSGGTGILNKPQEGNWDYLKALVRELRDMEPVFMAPDANVIVRLEPNSAPVSTRVKATDGGPVLLAVNRSTAEINVTFHLPGYEDGSVSVRSENRAITVRDGRLSDRFAPLAVHIYTFVK